MKSYKESAWHIFPECKILFLVNVYEPYFLHISDDEKRFPHSICRYFRNADNKNFEIPCLSLLSGMEIEYRHLF